MEIGQLDHVGKHGKITIGIDILQGQDLVRVLLQIQGDLASLFGGTSTIRHHGLFIRILGDGHKGLVALGLVQYGGTPCVIFV